MTTKKTNNEIWSDRPVDERNIILKVWAISLGLMECRYWIECEEDNNYLTKHSISEGNVATFNMTNYTITEYVADLIEEMFSFSHSYDKYTGNMDDIVASSICPYESKKHFMDDPFKAVSEPEYSTWGMSWGEGQYLDPDGLIYYLERSVDHGLDIEKVSKLFKIGEYAWEREATEEEIEEYYG